MKWSTSGIRFRTVEIAGLIIAIIAGLAAVGSILIATRSKQVSEESRDIASNALEVAKEANVISGRAEARDTERHDVRWEPGTVELGRYSLTNTGQHVAHRVHATFKLDKEQQVKESYRITPGEPIIFDFPHAVAEFEDELRERDAKIRAAQKSRFSIFGNPTSAHDTMMRMHWLEFHVSWETELGQHKTAHDRVNISLGPMPD